MSSINYMKDKKVIGYYEMWAEYPLLHDRYKDYFYKFVKACLEVDKRPSSEYLKLALYDSFSAKYDEKRYDEFVGDVIVLFEHLINFYNTTLP